MSLARRSIDHQQSLKLPSTFVTVSEKLGLVFAVLEYLQMALKLLETAVEELLLGRHDRIRYQLWPVSFER
jgi:hypothetical protein